MTIGPKWDPGRKRQPTEPEKCQKHRIHSQRTQTDRTEEKSPRISDRTPECYLGCLPNAYHI